MAAIYKIIEGTTYKLLETITYSKLNEITKSLLYIIEVLLTHIHSGNSVVDDGDKILRSSIDTTTFNTNGYGLIPVGGVIIWTGTNCPYGYESLPSWNGLYVRSSTSTVDLKHGSNYHEHLINHTHSITIGNDTNPNHSHNGTFPTQYCYTSYAYETSTVPHHIDLVVSTVAHMHNFYSMSSYGIDGARWVHHNHSTPNSINSSPTTNTIVDTEPLSVNVTFCKKV